ncbi:MAG: molybdopterin-dependent oxidoreductase, partial [Candidatus Sericytochromatia bacterium]
MPHSGKPTQTRQQICCLCEAMCGLDVAIAGDSIVSIRGNPRDGFSRGHLCPKALGLEDLHLDPDRLRAPQQRQGETWQALDWDQALDLAADRLTAIRRRYGPDAIGIYTGNPFAHNYGAMLFAPLLYASLGTR